MIGLHLYQKLRLGQTAFKLTISGYPDLVIVEHKINKRGTLRTNIEPIFTRRPSTGHSVIQTGLEIKDGWIDR